MTERASGKRRERNRIKRIGRGTSLAVQWLRRRASNARGMGSIPGGGTKIPHAVWCDQKSIRKKKKELGEKH